MPLAKSKPFYLTRVYSPQQQEMGLQLERDNEIRTQLWVNGTLIDNPKAIPITLTPGWNTLVVWIKDVSASSNVLVHPRVGFYLRLHARAESKKLLEK